MGQNSKIREVVRVTRVNNDPHGLPVPAETEYKVWRFVVGLRMRTLRRTMTRATGMETKYTETSLSKKKDPGMSRGFHRAYSRAMKNSFDSAVKCQKTYPGLRVSSSLTRTCVYE